MLKFCCFFALAPFTYTHDSNFSARFRAFNFRVELNVYVHLKFNLVFFFCSRITTELNLKTLKCFMHVFFPRFVSSLPSTRSRKNVQKHKNLNTKKLTEVQV